MCAQKTKLPALNRLDFAQRFREAKDIASFKEFLTLLKNYENDIWHGSIVKQNIVEAMAFIIRDCRKNEKGYQRKIKKLEKKLEEVKKAKYDNQTLSTSKHQKQREKVSTAERNQQQHETEQSSQLVERDHQLINENNENASLEVQLQLLDNRFKAEKIEHQKNIMTMEKRFIAEHEKVIQLQKDKEDLSNKLQAAEKNEAMWENNYRSGNNYARDMADKNQKLCLKIKSVMAGFGETAKKMITEIMCNNEEIDSLVGDPTVDVLNDLELQDAQVCYRSTMDNHLLQEQLDLDEPPPKRMRKMSSTSFSSNSGSVNSALYLPHTDNGHSFDPLCSTSSTERHVPGFSDVSGYHG